MKNFISFAFAAAMCLTTVGFTSCDDDNDDTPVTPAKSVNEVHGNYTGTMTFNKVSQKNVALTVDSTTHKLTVAELPVSEIVKTVLAKTEQAEALKSLKGPKCELQYKATLSKNLIKMELEKDTASFTVKIKDQTKKIDVIIAPKGEGLYNATTKKINVMFMAEKVNVDGTASKDFKTSKYLFSDATKK